MARAKAFTLDHSFYCIQCGNKGIPLARCEARRKEKFHRKKLYCCFCKEEVNHIECKTLEEVQEFKKNFKKSQNISFVFSCG